MNKPTNEKMSEAIKAYGHETVSLVIMIVNLSDPDGAWSLFQDTGNDDAVHCVEFLYFQLD